MGKKSVIAVLAENLKALMSSTPDLSSSPKLARKAGVSARTVNNAENARHDPKLSSVEAIARAFGLDTHQLLTPAVDKSFLTLSSAWNEADELGRELMLNAAEIALRRAHGGGRKPGTADG